MTKIRANIKGDSGLTDSQLMKSQMIFLERNREALDELERSSKLEMDRRRFEASAKPPKKNLWQRITNFLRF
tara:strand:- start:7949 stop:8164 length:216 start_codon:yes stop_codon:yes gene_type:complete